MTTTPTSTPAQFLLVAHIKRSRTITETLDMNAPPGPPGQLRQVHAQFQVQMGVGLATPSASDTLMVKVDAVVTLRPVDATEDLCKYTCTSTVEFGVVRSEGEDPWSVPHVMEPYFSFVHYLTRMRAEDRLRGAGFLGVALPVPERFAPEEGRLLLVEEGPPGVPDAPAKTRRAKQVKSKR